MTVMWWLCGGALLGWLLIYSQVVTVCRLNLQGGRRLSWRLLMGYFLRLSMVAAALLLALRQGLSAVLCMLCGFWLMRAVMVHRIQSGRAFYRQLRS